MSELLPVLIDSIYQDEKICQLYLHDLVIVTFKDRHKLLFFITYFVEIITFKWKIFRLKDFKRHENQ